MVHYFWPWPIGNRVPFMTHIICVCQVSLCLPPCLSVHLPDAWLGTGLSGSACTASSPGQSTQRTACPSVSVPLSAALWSDFRPTLQLYSGLECWDLEEGRRESIETQYKPKPQPQHALWPSHTSCLGHFKKAIVLMLPHDWCNDNYS